MLNNFAKIFDQLICKMECVAKWCKKINEKFLRAFLTVILCCLAVSFWGESALENIPPLKSVYYDTLAINFPDLIGELSSVPGRLILFFALALILLCYCFRKLYRPFALMMLHSTMGHDLSQLDGSLQKAFWLKKVNFSWQLPSHNIPEEQIITTICEQDRLFKSTQEDNWCSTIFYYGVAHIPLVFRLGYQWGQTKDIRLLHRFRPTESAQEFKELPEHEQEKMPQTNQSDRLDAPNYNLRSKHLLVSIATSYPIKKEDLSYIDPSDTMLRYDMQAGTPGVDFFNSYQKIRSYADRVVDDLRKIIKERGIETIHLAISSSVPFTFYLAQQMNTNQFCKIIVYHYDHGKYTWGIDVTEPEARKAIRWVENAKN